MPQRVCTTSIAILVMVLTLAACGSTESTIFTEITPEPSEAQAPTSALDQMELVFEGGHSRDEIQARLDESFALYGLEPTEDNYRRAGDVLVALSNNAMGEGCVACTEMGILDYLIQSGTLSGMEWHEAAAFSITFLAAGGHSPWVVERRRSPIRSTSKPSRGQLMGRSG